MRWLAWILVAACSAGPGPATRPAPWPGEPAPPEPAAPARDCDALVDHAVALGVAEQAPRPEPHATAADHEAIRRALRDELSAGCRALPRAVYACAMAATTLAALAACEPAQRTPSSSTSNSSVAPGGMTPPAPRSP